MKVHELLADPKHWTQGAIARMDGDGSATYARHPEACAWCLYGAVLRCYKDFDPVLKRLESKLGSITPWNDEPNRTHAEVLTLCKELDI